MTDDTYRFAELVVWLKEEGYSKEEVGRIVDRLREYDELAKTDSVMDSIEMGNFNIAEIIREALHGPDEPGG